MAKEGFNPIEFVMMRCICAFQVAVVWCLIAGYNPFKVFPWKEKKWTLVIRSLFGHTDFFLLNWGVTLAPVSIVMVVFQTSPFWIALVARIWLKEPLIPLELFGMLICFAMVGTIAS